MTDQISIECEKEILKPLVADCCEALNVCIFRHGFAFDDNNGPYCLKLRSGMQYLLDNFESTLNGDHIRESVELFDDALDLWKISTSSADCFNECDFETVIRPGVPVNHTWW